MFALVISFFLVTESRADEPLPRQLLFAPLPLAPSGENLSTDLSFEARVYRLPDRRRAEDYLLRAWFHPVARHSIFLELHYVGVEDSSRVNYGGGPFALGWSWALFDRTWLGVGSDVFSNLPLGDPSFHPLSAKASTIEWRLRLRPPTGDHVQLWGGWWMRRVSPPDNRDVPLSYYPSGSGWFATATATVGRFALHAVARHDVAGLPSLTWVGASVEMRMAKDLALEFGVDGQPLEDVADERLFDSGLRVAIHHRPRPIED